MRSSLKTATTTKLPIYLLELFSYEKEMMPPLKEGVDEAILPDLGYWVADPVSVCCKGRPDH